MVEKDNNHEFYLASNSGGRILVEEPRDYDADADVYEFIDEGGYFETTRTENVTLLETGANYLKNFMLSFGATEQVRFIHLKKREDTPEAQWFTVLDAAVDLMEMDFDDEPDNKSVSVKLIRGGLIKDIEDDFDTDYDITAETESYQDDSDLPFVQVCLDARQIFRRTLWDIRDDKKVLSINSLSTYFTIPIQKSAIVSGDSRAGSQFFGDVSVLSGASMFYFNNDRQKELEFYFDIDMTITQSANNGGFISLQLVKYENGDQFSNPTLIDLQEGPGSTISIQNEVGQRLLYQKIKGQDEPIRVTLEEGESLSLQLASNAPFPYTTVLTVDKARLIQEEDSLFRETQSRALRYYDLLAKLAKIQGYEFDSKLFGEGGKYEDLLIAHGTWLRNMPQVINQGIENEERRVQSVTSLKDAFEAGNVLLPLRYNDLNGKFTVEDLKDTQQNYISVSIRDKDGKLQEVSNKESYILGDEFTGSVQIGSETSGENYGEVNNLQSICGNAQWVTFLKNDAKYEVLTEYRTGSEDIELCRQLQWEDYPDQDSEYDNDWFFIDAKPATDKPGCDYVVKKWDSYFSAVPKNVYSPLTNYNWIFRPSNLLYNHSWRITPALWVDQLQAINFASSNCNSSLITETDGIELQEDQPIQHLRLQRPTIRPIGNTFETVLTEEAKRSLSGDKFGVIEYQYNGERKVGRLINGASDGTFEVVEAI